MTFHIVGLRRNTAVFFQCYGSFSVAPAEILRLEDGSFIVNNIFGLFHFVFECNPSKHDRGMMQILTSRTCLLSSFHIGSIFCFFPANFLSSTYTDKNNPFSWCTNRYSQLGTFSQPFCNRIFSNCLSHNSPAKG